MADLGFLSTVAKHYGGVLKNLIEGWNYYLNTEVVVGITQESNGSRGEVTNAELLYIHTNGSAPNNIPPRPVLEPAIAQPETQAQIKVLLRDAAVAAMVQGNKEKCEQDFAKAGMVGASACKKYITDGTNLAPNAPSTIRQKGSSKPLIDTASMMNSITYAVRKKR